MGERGLDEEHRPLEVDLEHLVPRRRGERAERFGQRRGGVVDDDVDPAEALDREVDEPLDIIELAEVGGHPRRLTATVEHGLHRSLDGIGLAAGDDHGRAGVGEPLGEREADAARSAGDDRDATLQAEQLADAVEIHA